MFNMKNRKLKDGVVHTTGDVLRIAWYSCSHPTTSCFAMSTFWLLDNRHGEWRGNRGDCLRRFDE